MAPDTLGALLAFLVFVAPGLCFELLRERRRPALEQTAFREASRIALTSLLFSGAALVVVVAVVAGWLRLAMGATRARGFGSATTTPQLTC